MPNELVAPVEGLWMKGGVADGPYYWPPESPLPDFVRFITPHNAYLYARNGATRQNAEMMVKDDEEGQTVPRVIVMADYDLIYINSPPDWANCPHATNRWYHSPDALTTQARAYVLLEGLLT